ncbi:MAG: DUF1957 domain-containing protein [Polyangiaceae bacterium]|nr:DUF1957 domain-containing protein [Polyangiaceae bacterium]
MKSGAFALVLHAHLPYVRHPEHARSIEERWLFEALWETYLPIVQMLDKLANDGVRAPFSMSVSPTLLAMWADPLLRSRFEDHLGRIQAVCERGLRVLPHLTEALLHHQRLLNQAQHTWEQCRGDVFGALLKHAAEGRVYLFTTAATHGFLPGLAAGHNLAWVRAQIALGRAFFESVSKTKASALWLPECAFTPVLDSLLAEVGVDLTVLDAHGLALGKPAAPTIRVGKPDNEHVVPFLPIQSPTGRLYVGRDLWAGRTVWAMDGYPSHPTYREFHRDLGFELSETDLCGETGPNGTRLTTGLRPYRITGREEKEVYIPEAAALLAKEHAHRFYRDRVTLWKALSDKGSPSLSVAPFDAELFGHFWHEGPLFLEELLRLLDSQTSGPRAVTLGDIPYLNFPTRVVEPAASTWGEGGFGTTWTGPRTAALWRPIHHVGRNVLRAVQTSPTLSGECGNALDQAIVETLLLQSSDFPFMVHQGTTVEYALTRLRDHGSASDRLLTIAAKDERAISPADRQWVEARRAHYRLFADLPSHVLRGALLA